MSSRSKAAILWNNSLERHTGVWLLLFSSNCYCSLLSSKQQLLSGTDANWYSILQVLLPVPISLQLLCCILMLKHVLLLLSASAVWNVRSEKQSNIEYCLLRATFTKSGDCISVLMLKIQVVFLRTRSVSWVHKKIILSSQLKIPSNWQSYQIGSGPCLQWAVARLASRGRWMQYLVVSPHSLRTAAILSA